MATSIPMSRFTQNYGHHLTDAQASGQSVLRLTQTKGRPSWVLQTEDAYDAERTAVQYLAAVLTADAAHGDLTGRAESLADSWPWVRFLPRAEREAMIAEVTDTLAACAALGSMAALRTVVEDWRATAEIHADPRLAATLSAPIDEPLDLDVE